MTAPVLFQFMPPLLPSEYAALTESIKAHGIQVPVLVDEFGAIIDGHHRDMIASELGIECPRDVRTGLTDSEKRTLAITLNKDRRHLTREQVRALLAESVKADPQLSDREHARRVGVDHKTAGDVRDELVGRGEIPHVSERTDTLGRQQPAPAPKTRPTPAPKVSNTTRVLAEMADGAWHTLADLAFATGSTETGVSARIRDLKKPQFGEYAIEKRRAQGGVYEYRIASVVTLPDMPAASTARQRVSNTTASRDERATQVEELAAQGNSTRQIAPLIGITESAVANIIRDYGIHVPADRIVKRGKRYRSADVLDNVIGTIEAATFSLAQISASEVRGEQIDSLIQSINALRKAANKIKES